MPSLAVALAPDNLAKENERLRTDLVDAQAAIAREISRNKRMTKFLQQMAAGRFGSEFINIATELLRVPSACSAASLPRPETEWKNDLSKSAAAG